MIGVLALDQPHVQRERGRLGERGEKAGREVGAETARAGEVGVRGDERVPDASTTTIASASAESITPLPCAPGASSGEHRPPERGSGRVDLGDRLVGLDLEREIEPARGRELGQQVIEQRDARRDVRLAASGCEPGAAHSSPRSMSAPSARSRSSIRS